MGKASLFTPSTAKTKETFQRVLRLSRKTKNNGPRLGAVATGLAPVGEIVFFAADTSRPGPDDIRGRINLEEKQEAADLDIIGLSGDDGQGQGRFRIAYCTDYEVYVTDVDYNKKDNGAQQSIQNIHGTPHPDAFASSKVARPKFRCLRFLTPTLLLLLQNKVNGKGAELLLLEISGVVTLRKSLRKKIKSATAMSVTLLPTASYSQIDQHAIAVAGADTSITIMTVDRFTSAPYGKVKFRPHSFIPSVHPTSITSLAFSTFNLPTTPWNSAPPQYLKLASTSIANTCVVQALPLTPHPSPPPENQPAHYLLKPVRSNVTENAFSALVALIAIAIGAFFLQAFTEIRGGTPEYLGAKGWLSKPIHDWIALPYMFEEGYLSAASSHAKITSDAVKTSLSAASEVIRTPLHAVESAAAEAQKSLGLRELLKRRDMGSDTSDNGNDGTDIIVRHSSAEGGETALSAELRTSNEMIEGEHKAKRWEELKAQEKEAWKERLVDAGEWTAAEGEAVLKGVFFSGLATAVGAMARNV